MTIRKLGDVLDEVKRPVPVADHERYRILGIRWYAEGAWVKNECTGAEIKASKLYRVETGDLIYNRLFAWKGSFAVITAELDGCFVSNEFPVFRVRNSSANTQYLLMLLSQPVLWEEIERESAGVASISRKRLKVQDFLDLDLPLPTPQLQTQIYTRYAHLKKETHGLGNTVSRGQANVAELRKAILQLAVMGRLVPQDPNDEPARELSMEDLVGQKNMKNGLSLKETSKRTPYRCLRLSALRNGAVDCDDAKPIALTEDRAAQYLVEKGDVFVVRGNGSKDLVGRAGLVECQPVGLIFPDLFIRIPLDSSGLLARYFLIAWNSPETRRTIEGLAKTTSGIWKVNQGHVASIALRVPSLPQQERIASKVDQLMSLCDDLEAKLQQSQTDVDNLLAAIVHKLVSADTATGQKEKQYGD